MDSAETVLARPARCAAVLIDQGRVAQAPFAPSGRPDEDS